MKVEKLTLKEIVIMAATAASFLIILGALCVPLLAYYKIGFSEGFYVLYRKLCHGPIATCFLINGYAMPLCSRCLGIWTGIFLTFVLYFERIKIGHALYVIFGILGLGAFVLEYFNLIFINNYIRLLEGLFIGIFLVVTIMRLEIKFKKGY